MPLPSDPDRSARDCGMTEDERQEVIEECAKVAADRAARLRTKAKSMKMPHRQSYFAQAIEARVIADSILGLLNPPKA